jgi:hypothetical protein
MNSRSIKALSVVSFCVSLSLTGVSVVTSTENKSETKVPGVYFTSELWPGEGIPRFKARKDLPTFETPSAKSKQMDGKWIKAGQLIEYSETRFQTLTPVSIIVKKELTIDARDYGKISYLSRDAYYRSGSGATLQLKKGDTVKILQYRAEGEYLFEVNEHVYGGECSICESVSPKTAWWVKTNSGGWVKIEENSVEFLPRQM